jgi:hypothetical protein
LAFPPRSHGLGTQALKHDRDKLSNREERTGAVPNPKIAVALVRPLEPGVSADDLISELRLGAQRDELANVHLNEARDKRDAWLKAGQSAQPRKLTWDTMMEASGLSRKALRDALANPVGAHPSTDRDTTLEHIRRTSADFWSAKEERDQIRAERNELLRRAYVGDVPTSELAPMLGMTEAGIYNILQGRKSKLLSA